MDDVLALIIAVGITAALGLIAIVVVVRSLARQARVSGAMNARRDAAILFGPISVGAPFELTGVARAGTPLLYVDAQLQVLGGADVEVTFRSCGVRLAYEVLADGERVAGGDVKVPADDTKIGPHVSATDIAIPSHRTRVRCTVSVGRWLTLSPGARVTLRGTVTPLPNNEVHSLAAWIG